ncbi:MAG: hypothetical protein K2X74_04705, partial [Acetobacteraceae bacterium]|nr:hypothetical protein [Acetobacteraceae bacterium]
MTALAVFGGVAVLNSIFLAFLLFFHHSGLSRNKWLGLLFLSLSVRIGKSLLMLVFPNAPDSVPAIGLVGMVLTGPLFYFYIRAFYLNKNLDRTDFFHFLLAVVTSALLWLNSNTIVLVLYILAAVQLWGYMLWVWLQWRNYKHEHRG